MKRTTLKITAFLVLILSLSIILQAQDRILTESELICNKALELPFNEGINLITSNFEKCQNTDQQSKCLLKMYFITGYLYQMASNEFPNDQKNHLESSIAFYQRAHEIDRMDVSIINNMFLVYKALGNTRSALNILDRAIEADQKNKTKYDINKGDIYYENNDYKKAIEQYKAAFFSNVNNEGLVWKIFDIYSKLPNQAEVFKGLYSFSEELFEQDLNDLARGGFLYALKNALLATDSVNAENACIRWAEAISRKNTVSGSFTDELPDLKSWSTACNKELQMLLMNSFVNTGNLKWWTKDDFRRHISASLLLKMESAALMEGNLKNAVQLLESALDIAPEFYRYRADKRLEKYFPVKLDIAIELSRLYNRYPNLDSNQAKFNALIQELFNEKSLHYLQNDLESIQKSHTMLGLIYADRNVWKSSWFAGNAIFQLERAIEVQKKIENKNPEKFKPVPALHQMLAKGYHQTNQPEKEYRTLIDAAVGYLDLDNLTMSESIVQNAKRFSGQDAEYNQKLKELGLITTMRLNIRNGSYDFKSSDVKALEKTITESELFRLTSEKKDNSFLNRQKFKIMADMGSKCSELNPAYKNPIFEMKALDYIDKEKALGNSQDINRLYLIQEKFIKNIDQGDLIKVNQNLNKTDVKNQSKSWSLNSGSYQTQIEVNPDLIIAGKVYEKILNENSDKPVDSLNGIQINQGKVIITDDALEKETIEKAKLQQVKGVKKVQVMKIKPIQ